MKVRKVVSLCLLGILISLFSGCDNVESYSHENEDYGMQIAEFNEVKMQDIYSIQERSDKFFLYTGRETCDKCVIFVDELSHVEYEQKIPIYYLDSITSYDESSEELRPFRDKYGIEFVPSFKFFNGEKNVSSN